MVESSDLRMTRIPLSHGAGHMPALGFGTLIPDPAVTITATRDALEAGFRHFDCAERYGNEREVGEAGPRASNRLSRQVWKDSGSSIWISISFTLHLHFNPETIRTRGIKTEMSFTTKASLCSTPGKRWKLSWITASAGPSDFRTSV